MTTDPSGGTLMDDTTEAERDAARRLRPHGTDGISLTFGLIFVGAAVLWLIARLASLNAAVVGWMTVSGLFVMGAVGLVHALTRAVQRRERDDLPT